MTIYSGAPIPASIRSRYIDNGNGLSMHILEAGSAAPERPLVLLLHGFPELAYSWRKVMPALADAGYYVVAPDLRGYGHTTGWDPHYDGDVDSFRLFNLVRDVLGLLAAIGRERVEGLVGHDFGSMLASCCATIRPDVFRSVALMSAPANTPPPLRLPKPASAGPDIHEALKNLERPRKHYQWYYSTRQAEADMLQADGGFHAFLRAYYHMKSADWADNTPFALSVLSAGQWALLPTYYVMDLNDTMAETVRPHLPSPDAIARCAWLPEPELAAYSGAFQSTGLQGALNWYRCRTEGRNDADLAVLAGRRIEVPATFIAGASDWGIHQSPGALERLCNSDCSDFRGCHLIPGAGHWVQQEQPDAVINLLLPFLDGAIR